MEGRFIALDIGARRIGVAISAGVGKMVLPLETMDGRDFGKAARKINVHIVEDDVVGLVLGCAVDLHGRSGRAVERVERFERIMKREMKQKKHEIPIYRWDERMSSVSADRLLDDIELSWQRRRSAIDQVAACH